jgi:hypothetical protein
MKDTVLRPDFPKINFTKIRKLLIRYNKVMNIQGKRPRHEADHWPPSNADVKNMGSYTSTLPYVFMAWCLTKHSIRIHKHRDNHTFIFTTASRMALGPTQPPIQWVHGVLSLGVKRPGREADHSPPSSAEVKNAWSYISITLYTGCRVLR